VARSRASLAFAYAPFAATSGDRACARYVLILDDEIIGRKSDVKSRLFHIYGFELNNR